MMKKGLCMMLLAGMTIMMAGCGNTQSEANEVAAEESTLVSTVASETESDLESEASEIVSEADENFNDSNADESLSENENSMTENEALSSADDESGEAVESVAEPEENRVLCTKPGTELYEPVLQSYLKVLHGGSVELDELGNNTVGLGIFQTTGHCEYDAQSKCIQGIQDEDTISYCFEDLNDDGYEELILKCANTDDYMLKVQIWTNDGENIRQLSSSPLGVTNDQGLIFEMDCEPHNGVIYGYNFDNQGKWSCDYIMDISSEAEYYDKIHSGDFEVLE